MDEQIGNLLLTIYRGCRLSNHTEIKKRIFESVRDLLAFDIGYWSIGTGKSINQRSVYIYTSSSAIGKEATNQAAVHDCFLTDALRSPGVTIKNEGRGNYHSALHTVIQDNTAGIFAFIGFLRSHKTNAFTESERQSVQCISPHLLEAYRLNLFTNIEHIHLLESKSHYIAAACDSHGLLHTLEPGFTDLFISEWPSWQGPFIPRDIRKLLPSISCNKIYKGKCIIVSISKLNGLIYIRVRQKSCIDQLSNQEEVITRYLIKGQTYKEIAAALNIASSTVTNHVNSIYRKLGVTNKTELSQLFFDLCFGIE